MDKDERSLLIYAASVYTGVFAILLVGSIAVGGESVLSPGDEFSAVATAEASRYVCANHSAFEDNG